MPAEVIQSDVDEKIASLQALVDGLRDSMSAHLAQVEASNYATRQAVEKIAADLVAQKLVEAPQSLQQQDIIDGGGGGAGSSYSMRYRNDTERATLGLPIGSASDSPPNSVPIHRLEWIAQDSPYDPSTLYPGDVPGPANEWANELWQPVLHGEAVEYVEEPPPS